MLNHKDPLDPVFLALSDPTRRSVVDHLSRGPASVSQIAAPLGISLPGVLQHLKVLEGSGLVRSEKVGRTRICRLDAAPLSRAEAWMAERRRFWEMQLDQLEAYLASAKDTH